MSMYCKKSEVHGVDVTGDYQQLLDAYNTLLKLEPDNKLLDFDKKEDFYDGFLKFIHFCLEETEHVPEGYNTN